MIRTFFVLDFDGTYDLDGSDPEDEYGVEPVVYLIPKASETAVCRYARLASKMFLESENETLCIGDYFDQLLKANGIPFQIVGDLHIPFRERQWCYLDEGIAREIV